MTEPRSSNDAPAPSALPTLGRRGGGWVGIQLLLIGGLMVAGVRGRGDVEGTLLNVAVFTGTVLIVIGAALIFAGIRALSRSVSAMPKPVDGGELVEDGPYAYVRHPIYLGLMFVAYGWSVAMDSIYALIVAVIFTVFLDLKSRREETWLREQYPEYRVYASHTKRFVPYIY